VNIVAVEGELIERVLEFASWERFSDDDLDEIMGRLAPLMKFRRPREITQVLLNIKDLLNVKEYITFGPEHERLTVEQYRQKVEQTVLQLVVSNPVLQKLHHGSELTPGEVQELAELLGKQSPYVNEEILRKVYDNKKAKFIQFIKHILGLEKISSFAETVTEAFDTFITRHNDYSNQQIRFLLTIKSFILQTGDVTKKDLVNPPFTQIHPKGIRGVFSPGDIEEILELANKLVA